MARPRTQGVEYFPHRVRHGETMFILERHFGNDGYACWYKLLEILASRPSHCIDCGCMATWEYMKARMMMDDDRLNAILDLLATLGAIDPDLWKDRVIWCQELVDEVECVYRKRRTKPPLKPSFCHRNPRTGGVSAPESTQSRVERVENINTICSESSRDDSEPHVLTIPLIPKHGEYPIYQTDIDEWSESYPGVDVMRELRRCRQWALDNPKRRKTRSGIRRHISSWLARAQDRSSPQTPQKETHQVGNYEAWN